MNVYQEFLNRRDCILLLVDIQKAMLDLCVDPDRTVFNTAALIEAAELFEIPVLCSVQNSVRLGAFLPELTNKILQPKIWDKLEFNCFESENIARAIGETGRKTLLMAGLEGHVCIFHTGVGALRLGYRVHVAHDAVTSRSASDKQVGMQRLDRAGAVISSTEMIIFELLNRAGTREFREMLPLLKKFKPG
ncbi:MAG: isochorismatase family protein [Syntrophobacteraceae bacterium]